jgi:CRP-like cAMP-binding protein
MLSEGEQGVGLFILTKGTVRITRKNSSDGAEQVLGTAGVERRLELSDDADWSYRLRSETNSTQIISVAA